MKFTFKREYQRCMKGVYIFHIGQYFYIGRSKSIGTRINQHQQKINYSISNYDRIKNSLNNNATPTPNMYMKIAQYILENPKLNHFQADVVFCCSDTKSMCIKEHQLLRLYEKHPMCLNSVFYGSIVNDNHNISFKKVGRFLYYFETDDPNNLMPCIQIRKKRNTKHVNQE